METLLHEFMVPLNRGADIRYATIKRDDLNDGIRWGKARKILNTHLLDDPSRGIPDEDGIGLNLLPLEQRLNNEP